MNKISNIEEKQAQCNKVIDKLYGVLIENSENHKKP